MQQTIISDKNLGIWTHKTQNLLLQKSKLIVLQKLYFYKKKTKNKRKKTIPPMHIPLIIPHPNKHSVMGFHSSILLSTQTKINTYTFSYLIPISTTQQDLILQFFISTQTKIKSMCLVLCDMLYLKKNAHETYIKIVPLIAMQVPYTYKNSLVRSNTSNKPIHGPIIVNFFV